MFSRGRGVGEKAVGERNMRAGEKLYFSEMRDLTLRLLKKDQRGKTIRTYRELMLSVPVQFHKTFEHSHSIVKTVEWMQKELPRRSSFFKIYSNNH